MIKIDTETMVPTSPCCECGHLMNGASGDGTPSPGDFTLCISCASLNIFDENLKLRYPTDDEFFAAAASSDLQALRRAILAIPKDLRS